VAKDNTIGEKVLGILLQAAIMIKTNDAHFDELVSVLVEALPNNPQEKEVMKIKQIAMGLLAGKLCVAIDSSNSAHSNWDPIVQSSLLSGGIEESSLHMFSRDSLDQIIAVCKHSFDDSLIKAFNDASDRNKQSDGDSIFDLKNDDPDGALIKAIIYANESKACDLVIA
jgi:hypothetical protein